MKKTILVFIMFISSPLFAQENKKTAVELLQTLRSETHIRVAFVERVKLPFLKKALISEGQLVISPTGDFIREIKSPKTSITVLKGETIQMVDSSGTISIDKTTAPQILSAITLLQALVSADLETLEKHYLLSIESGDDQSWSLTLESRVKRGIFKKCTVFGTAQRVQTLLLIESDGVERKIEFGKLSTNTVLTPQEIEFLKRP